jgi:hypothetical protein
LDTRSSERDRELFEIALIKLVRFREIVHPASLVKRLEELRGEIAQEGTGVGRDLPLYVNTGSEAPKNPPDPERGDNPGPPVKEPQGRGAASDVEAVADDGQDDISERIIRHFSRKRRALAEFLKRAKRYTLENNLLTISYDGKEKYSYDHVHESSAKRYLEKEIRDLLQMDIRLNVAIEGNESQPENEKTLSENVTKVMKIFKGDIVPTN